MRKVLLVGFLFLTAQIGFAQTYDKARLDLYLQTLADNNKFMGSVAISVNGTPFYTKAVGFADVAQKVPLATDSKFRIGSISKMFTAVLVFKAIEEKKLALDEHLSKFFPSIKNADKITIAHMLSHRSGIHNFTANLDYMIWYFTPRTPEQLVASIEKGGSDFEPDAKFSYSNSNFVLLSLIVEKLYQKSYNTLLTERIITPLGLRNTYYGGKIDVKNKECFSYNFKGMWVKEPETDMSVPIGAGAVVSNPTDLGIFIDALFQGKLVSSNSLAQMMTMKDGMGMGLMPIPFGGKQGYGHGGAIDAFNSLLLYLPSDHVSFSVTSNGNNFSNNDIAIAALKIFYGQQITIPDFTTKQLILTTAELDKYLGVYASKDVPLKISVTKKDNVLFIQPSGQGVFPMVATAVNIFSFDQAGVVLEFTPEKNQMLLKQGGRAILFTKE